MRKGTRRRQQSSEEGVGFTLQDSRPLWQAMASQALLTRGPQRLDSSMILCLLTSAFGFTKMSSTPVKRDTQAQMGRGLTSHQV